jgi:PAS domain S-box-containing protein
MNFQQVKVYIKFYWLAFTLLLVLSLITLYIFYKSLEREKIQRSQLFELRTAQVQMALERRITDYIQILKGARGLFNASGFVSKDEWSKYYKDLELSRNFGGIQGLGFARFIKENEKDLFVETIKKNYHKEYRIFPAGKREFYAPVTYLEPGIQSNIGSLGYDMYSDQVRKTAMDLAYKIDDPVLSGKIILLKDLKDNREPGILLYLPIYQKYKTLADSAIQSTDRYGYVFTAFRTRELMEAILKNEFNDLDIEIYISPITSPENLLYDKAPEVNQRIKDNLYLHQTRNFKIAHQNWILRFGTLPAFEKRADRTFPFYILSGGLTISLLVFFTTLFLSGLRKAQEQVVKESERFRFLINTMPQKVWQADSNGVTLYFNKEYSDFTGYSMDELTNWEWKKVIHPEDLEGTMNAWLNSIFTGQPYKIYHRIRASNGSYRWHLTRATPKKGKNNTIEMWIGTSTDIHDQKVMTEQLARTNNDLDNFIYTASHDLKAPVSNIEGLVSALEQTLAETKSQPADTEILVEMIKSSLKRFQRTIRYLTEISKIQKNIQEDISEIKINEVINDVLSDTSELIRKSNAEITVTLSDCGTIRFSLTNLRSIIYNLLTNAIKYSSPDRKPIIDIRCRSENNFFILEVEDNGLGLREDQKEKVFGMFKRAHSHVEGTGVGLYLVKRIIDNSGGRIELDSKEGKGSIFRVFLKTSG